jgi:hypothetical protein
MTRWVVLVAVLALGACANPQNEAALLAPQTLVGMPKGELLACAGVPQRTAAADGAEVLTYGREQVIVERDWDEDEFPWLGPRGPMLWRPEVSTWTRRYRCEATVTVRGGRVAELRYNADRDASLCYEILGNCLGR